MKVRSARNVQVTKDKDLTPMVDYRVRPPRPDREYRVLVIEAVMPISGEADDTIESVLEHMRELGSVDIFHETVVLAKDHDEVFDVLKSRRQQARDNPREYTFPCLPPRKR